MKISEEKMENGILIRLEGRLDTVTAPALENYMSGRLKDCGCLLLDMEGLKYISSAGLRVLLSLQKTMNRQGRMEIRGVNEVVMEVFEMTGFVDILNIL